MATWKEQREMLEALGSTRRHGWGMSVIQAERHAIAIQAAIARLDAAERCVAATDFDSFPRGNDAVLAKDAYDALVREQDGGR